MTNILSILLTVIFTALSLLHFFWAFSKKQISSAVLPSKDGKKVLNPSLISTLMVAVGLLLFATTAALFHSNIVIEKLQDAQTAFAWLAVFIFLGRAIGDFQYIGAFRKITNTPFAKNDLHYFTPLCFLLSAGMFILLNQ